MSLYERMLKRSKFKTEEKRLKLYQLKMKLKYMT